MIPTANLTDAQRKSAYSFLKFLWDDDFQWARAGHLPASQKVIDSAAFKALPFRFIWGLPTSSSGFPACLGRTG